MKRKKMGKIKYVYIEKKKCDFSQQIVAIFFYYLIIEYGDHFNREAPTSSKLARETKWWVVHMK